jgi:hypothetical protein
MKSTKNLIFFLLFISSTAFATDKPIWTIDYKKLDLPEHGKPISYKKWETVGGAYDKPEPEFHIHFTSDNKILVGFLHYRLKKELATKDTPEIFDSSFTALLLSRENGELIRRIEWPFGESTQRQRIGYHSRIYPLPSGGYVGIINQRLQVLDSSFNVIQDRILDTIERGEGSYSLIVPLSGEFIILRQLGQLDSGRYERIVEVIDTGTFKTIERFEQPSFSITDIWEDRLLAVQSLAAQSIIKTRNRRFYEKKIGASQWNDLGLKQVDYANAKYIYNGAIIISDSIEKPFDAKNFWFMLEDGKKSDSVFESRVFSTPSWNTSVIACRRNKVSFFRRMFDLFGKHWIEAYDLNSKQVLLTTKKYSEDSISGEYIATHAISPDGDSIILMTNKKIELYNVNSKKDKKK